MKQFIFSLSAILLLTSGLQAQVQQSEALFDHARVRGAFAAPLFEWGLNNDLGSATGGGAGIVIDNMFIGAYGLGSIDFQDFIETGDIQSVKLAHGGFWIGGNWPSHKLLHFYSSAKVGWGALDIEVDDPFLTYRDLDKVFVLTPEIGLELNLTRWMRLSGTVGYRYLNGVNANQAFSNEDFRGTTAGITLRIGWFGRPNPW
jgi:hypothetical protein